MISSVWFVMRRPWVNHQRTSMTNRTSQWNDILLPLGYNFDQITCESCKAFFRRNALSNNVSVVIELIWSLMLTPHSLHCLGQIQMSIRNKRLSNNPRNAQSESDGDEADRWVKSVPLRFFSVAKLVDWRNALRKVCERNGSCLKKRNERKSRKSKIIDVYVLYRKR